MELKDLVGSHILSGIEMGTIRRNAYGYFEQCEFIKFTLDGVTYKAVENPDDGYRSYMDELETEDEPCKIKLPNIEVCCHMMGDCLYEKNDVLVFVDSKSGKEILKIGTQNTNDYYPYCILEYTPENMYVNQ